MNRFILPLVGALAGAVVGQARHRQRGAERLAAATLETLLNAIDANDAVTGAHARRVAVYSLILADALGLDKHTRREVERVALFHDIGKLHAALFDIIHDDDELTPDERREIATHPKRGADVLAPLCAFYPELGDGVLAHHECWNGSGYPRGLAGTQIPLTSRIVALGDTFDAITASRRYHRGEDVSKAVDVIRKGCGVQFDPELATLFLSPEVLDRVMSAMNDARPRREPRKRNRRRSKDGAAPDVTFRWRERVSSASEAG